MQQLLIAQVSADEDHPAAMAQAGAPVVVEDLAQGVAGVEDGGVDDAGQLQAPAGRVQQANIDFAQGFPRGPGGGPRGAGAAQQGVAEGARYDLDGLLAQIAEAGTRRYVAGVDGDP